MCLTEAGHIGPRNDDSAPTKVCTKCGIDKPLTAYGKQTGGRFGLHPAAKSAVRPPNERGID
jgi:hypothetical protein